MTSAEAAKACSELRGFDLKGGGGNCLEQKT